MTSLPEPGQSFFELGPKPEPSGYMPSELVPGSTTATTFSQNLVSLFDIYFVQSLSNHTQAEQADCLASLGRMCV